MEPANCVGRTELFDLDISRLPQWQEAMDLCAACPAKAACQTLSNKVGPRSMIWAGRPYNENGDYLDDVQLRRRDSLRGANSVDQPALWAS